MPQMTPIAANSNHPRLLTGSAYRQTPSGPRCRQAPLLADLEGDGWAAGADVAGAADEVAAAGAVPLPSASGDGVWSAFPARVVPTPEPVLPPVLPPPVPAAPLAPSWPGRFPAAPAAPGAV